jgi:hypothetical protein
MEDWFPSHAEWGGHDILVNGAKPGVWYDYVPNCFLDAASLLISGWMMDAIVLVQRYQPDSESSSAYNLEIEAKRLEAWLASHGSYPNGVSWLRREEHGGFYGDDVLSVAKSDKDDSVWVFAWDCDVSDCGIGRLVGVTVEEVASVLAISGLSDFTPRTDCWENGKPMQFRRLAFPTDRRVHFKGG